MQICRQLGVYACFERCTSKDEKGMGLVHLHGIPVSVILPTRVQ